MSTNPLIPARELASKRSGLFPGERAEYRTAREQFARTEDRVSQAHDAILQAAPGLACGPDHREQRRSGRDPRDAPDITSLWSILDLTPEGRGTDWYRKLFY